MADLITMNEKARPDFPNEMYSGGYWYGLEAAVVYLLLAIALLVNMIGYIRGHYPQHFELTKDQRTLVVQTMVYLFWLAGGAGVFVAVEGYTYSDSVSVFRRPSRAMLTFQAIFLYSHHLDCWIR
jgi:potassium channel subfamily K, other eukaryote